MNKLVLRLTDKQLETLERFADSRQCSETDAVVVLIESLCGGFVISRDAHLAVLNLMKHFGSGSVAEPQDEETSKGGRPMALDPALVEVASEFRATGMSYENIAKELQAQGVTCSRDSVRRALTRARS